MTQFVNKSLVCISLGLLLGTGGATTDRKGVHGSREYLVVRSSVRYGDIMIVLVITQSYAAKDPDQGQVLPSLDI